MVEPIDSSSCPVYSDTGLEGSEDLEKIKAEYPKIAEYLQNPEGFYDAIKEDIALAQELNGLFAKLGHYDVDVQGMDKSELAKLLGEAGQMMRDAKTLIEKLVVRAIIAILAALISGRET